MTDTITNVLIEEKDYTEPEKLFNQLKRGFSPTLLTGKGPEDISRYSVIGIEPHTIITYEGDEFIIKTQRGEKRKKLTFKEGLKELLNENNFHTQPWPANRLGALGYLSYELFTRFENIKKQTKATYTMPLFEWVLYNTYYLFHRDEKKLWKVKVEYQNPSLINEKSPVYPEAEKGFQVTDVTPECSKEKYIDKVKTIQNYIEEGEVYEVNLSQGLKGHFSGSPLALFNRLYSLNSAPYSAYMERENQTIISSSPELYLRCEKDLVETRPIKGTAPRSENRETDSENKKVLLNCPKNQAELYMIIDLMRNDLSRVSEYGSVEVLEAKRVEAYENVFHLIGIIQSRLKKNKDYADLIEAAFPGGSITGCPRVRCMEITEEVEESWRNIYTGSLFIMNREMLNSSIVIRSCIIQKDNIYFNSGGAVTIDSDPIEEYRETEIKLRSLLKAVGHEGIL